MIMEVQGNNIFGGVIVDGGVIFDGSVIIVDAFIQGR